jgi:hypothetical protein
MTNDARNQQRICYCCDKYDSYRITLNFTLSDCISDWHRGVSNFELEIVVTCGHLEYRLIHELWVQNRTFSESRIVECIKFVLLSFSVCFVHLVGRVHIWKSRFIGVTIVVLEIVKLRKVHTIFVVSNIERFLCRW